MEKNESYIWWLQPNSGDLQSQIASICVNQKFYALNLRLEKVIFRHIRLTKDFVNVEFLEDGTEKLRIPRRLLREKLRTAMRAQVCEVLLCGVCLCDIKRLCVSSQCNLVRPAPKGHHQQTKRVVMPR